MNWILLITITLTLTNPFNLGIADSISNSTSTTQFDKLLLQAIQQEIQAAFTATPTKGTAPLTVQFDAGTSIGDNLTFEWDFGDGTTGTGRQIEHTYEFAGTYIPKLSATSNGISSFNHIILKVSDVAAGDPFPESLRASTTPEGREQFRVWALRYSLAQRGLLKLLDFVDDKKVMTTKTYTPDRKWVTYEELDYERSYGIPGLISTGQFYLVNLETGTSVNISQIIKKRITGLSLSEDGSLLAYREEVSNGSIYILDLKTQQSKVLLNFSNDNLSDENLLISSGMGYKFNASNTKLGFFMQYGSDVPESSDYSFVDYQEGLILFEVNLTSSDQVLDIGSLENIVMQEGFVAKITFDEQHRIENFGGTYWQGDEFRWYWDDELGNHRPSQQPNVKH